jgi:two-component system chemotaxis sensor kinase CheA
MEVIFDISQDELPIFLAEVDEHLQVMDEILVQLERVDSNSDLLNEVFRSAHTLKGMAGVIGHDRMTRLTHALETLFDSIRKNIVPISSPLIDLCLEAVDGLRLVRDEVVNGQSSDVDVDRLVEGILAFLKMQEDKTPMSLSGNNNGSNPAKPANAAKKNGKVKKVDPKQDNIVAVDESITDKPVEIQAVIKKDSIASAARAFQLMLAMQELGEILVMDPTQEQIETSTPVAKLYAKLKSSHSDDEIFKKLNLVSEVEELIINGRSYAHEQSKAPVEQSPKPENPPKGYADTPTPSETALLVQKQRGNGHISGDMTVRTSVERLDILMNLVGELITDRNHLLQIRNRMEAEARGDGDVDKLSETVTHLGRITDQLQEEVMRIRMLPISNVMHKFPRLVRDLAQKTGKLIDLVIQGEDTELDRSMIEEINDPLIHLVRNSVDHGIESSEVRIAAGKPERGTITIAARHEQGRIILTVEDDGRGIDPEVMKKAAVHKGLISPEEAAMLTEEQAINLVFLPGFSTAEKVTDISGRGIGMDIVQTNIQRVNGVIAVDTHLGQGTQFQIVLPLTLAIVRTLLVEVGKSTYAIPLVMVTETLRLQDSDIKTIGGKPVTVLRGKTLPLIHMAEVFDLPTNESSSKYPFAVVVHSGKQRVGLVVDSFCGEEEVVVKSIGALVGNVPGISSAAILGDGRVTLIVDVMGLFKLTGIH